MNIAVVDDEEIIRKQIHGFIERQKPGLLVSDFATGEDLLAANVDFDIIFLDIQMEGMGGIETARNLRQRNADAVLVFITGMKEYVFEAFDWRRKRRRRKQRRRKQRRRKQRRRKQRRRKRKKRNRLKNQMEVRGKFPCRKRRSGRFLSSIWKLNLNWRQRR